MASFILEQIEEFSWSGIASGMKAVRYRSALILRAGEGLGASLSRVFQRDGGMRVK